MSIIREPNGSYTLCYSKKDVFTNKLIRTKKRGFRTQKEAKEYERTLSREKSLVTFFSLFEESQKNIEQEQDTLKGKYGIIDNYLPQFKTLKYEDMTKSYLLQVRANINNLELAPKTKNKIIEIIKTTSKYANEIYDLPDNAKVLKRFKQVKTEFDIWTPEDYFKFENSLIGKYDDCIPFFRCLFFTGLRKGEARALQVSDYDSEEMVISISKSMRKYKSSLKAPKTPAGVRKVKLDIKTNEILKPLKSNEKWLFGDYKPISRDRVDRAFQYGIEASNVKKIRIHDLRHSHASFLIMKGANIVAVSKRLGHANINTTLNTYAHLFKDSENQLIDLLNVANV